MTVEELGPWYLDGLAPCPRCGKTVERWLPRQGRGALSPAELLLELGPRGHDATLLVHLYHLELKPEAALLDAHLLAFGQKRRRKPSPKTGTPVPKRDSRP